MRKAELFVGVELSRKSDWTHDVELFQQQYELVGVEELLNGNLHHIG